MKTKTAKKNENKDFIKNGNSEDVKDQVQDLTFFYNNEFTNNAILVKREIK